MQSHLFKFSLLHFIPRDYRIKVFTVHRKEKRITKLNITFIPSREQNENRQVSTSQFKTKKKITNKIFSDKSIQPVLIQIKVFTLRFEQTNAYFSPMAQERQIKKNEQKDENSS